MVNVQYDPKKAEIGPLLISSLHETQQSRGVPAVDSYTTTMYLLAALLGVGLLCNSLVKPVAQTHFEPTTEERA